MTNGQERWSLAKLSGAFRSFPMPMNDDIPDIRDGLTRKERIVLRLLHEIQRERGGHDVPTPLLWGRVCEYFYIRPEELTEMLARLGARR